MVSTYYKDLLMNNAWKTSAAATALPAHFYLGYSTTAPTLTGTNITEPAASTGYKRAVLDGALGPSANGIVKNTKQISMPDTTANQGTATHFVIFDALTSGHFLAGGPLLHSRVMEIESSMVFKVNAITITLEDKAA